MKCKKNLCTLCESNHKEHKIIYYEKIMPNRDDIETKLRELRQTIDVFEDNIKKIIGILNKVVQSIKIYYNIKNNICQSFYNEKVNYQSLSNIIHISNNDYTINDMNEIINQVDITKKFDYIYKLYKKINYQNNNSLDINEYSYECLNKANLFRYLYTGTNEVKIQINLRNNSNSTWPENKVKLIFDKSSDFKAKEIILKPQKSQENALYEINFKGLSKYPPKEYKSKLKFCVNGHILGEILTIKFIIKEKITPESRKYIKEFRDLFNLDNIEFPDKYLLKILKKIIMTLNYPLLLCLIYNIAKIIYF